MIVEIEVPEGFELLTNEPASTLVDQNNKVVVYGFGLIQKANPHAQLKAQYALDVETCKSIKGFEAWQLWQASNKFQNWVIVLDTPNFYPGDKYRRHPHADSIIKYHKCSDADKKRWQCRWGKKVEWVNICECKYERDDVPMWREEAEYRLKPRTITINGKEYNAPMNVAPEVGSQYWALYMWDTAKQFEWNVSRHDFNLLLQNRVFATKEDCQAVCNAFNEILEGLR
jgi:hypothetical protein